MPVLGERKDLASGSKLIFDCTDKGHYRVASTQLRFALARGYRLKAVQRALRFDMAKVFEKFIAMWRGKKEEQAAYKNQKDPRFNPALYAAIKLMLCSLFGRCTMRNETDSQELVTSATSHEVPSGNSTQSNTRKSKRLVEGRTQKAMSWER